jgi:hypothetical protein
MLAAIKRQYERSRKPLAFAMVALILVAGILPSKDVQLAASVALLTIILTVLFEIHDKLQASSQKWFASFADAAPKITGEIRRRLERRRPVRVRWVGVTMEAGWPLIQNLLIDAIASNRALSVELGVVDPVSIQSVAVQIRIRSTISSIEEFIANHDERLVASKCSLAIYPYGHRPTWHALLIDDDTLFYSPSLPQNFTFSSPQSGVEIVKSPLTPEETSRIEHVSLWADEIFKSTPLARSSNV